MRKKEEISHKKPISDSQNSQINLKKIVKQDSIILDRIKELTNIIRAKYNISTRDLLHLIDDKEILIPVSIFTKKLSILEAITKYLKEELTISYHQIGILLNRNEKNIWHTYSNSKKKYTTKLEISESKYFIPISIFQNKLGALENTVLYLKDELGLSYHNIAELLERDDRTIWTMYNRVKKKIKDEK